MFVRQQQTASRIDCTSTVMPAAKAVRGARWPAQAQRLRAAAARSRNGECLRGSRSRSACFFSSSELVACQSVCVSVCPARWAQVLSGECGHVERPLRVALASAAQLARADVTVLALPTVAPQQCVDIAMAINILIVILETLNRIRSRMSTAGPDCAVLYFNTLVSKLF